jgi:signal recognition particle subunit SRP54
MFASLHDKLQGIFKKIGGKGTLSQTDLDATMREVRMALLEADVNFGVAKSFCQRVSERAIGQEIHKALSPAQQIVKLVNEALIETMGGGAAELNVTVAPPAVIMLVGLQGSGKTTSAGKLARYIKDNLRKRVLLVPADVYRPAAIEQLTILGKKLEIDVHPSLASENPRDIVRAALQRAHNQAFDVMIIDTAGRLQIDTELMDELKDIHRIAEPHETLLVADAMTGQEAVNVAQGFDGALTLSGLILTKLDGDARGGAALSMRAVTGKPIKFIGVGEKLEALEVFHPERMASRILGMGDMLTLIERASKEVTLEDSEALHRKMKKNEFTLDDFMSQMKMMRRMGGIASIASMIPGLNKLTKDIDSDQAEREMKRIEAIILSMTPRERRNHGIIDGSRRKRIARGSGTSVEEINRLLKQFTEMKKMMQKLAKGGLGGLMNMFGGARPGFRS